MKFKYVGYWWLNDFFYGFDVIVFKPGSIKLHKIQMFWYGKYGKERTSTMYLTKVGKSFNENWFNDE